MNGYISIESKHKSCNVEVNTAEQNHSWSTHTKLPSICLVNVVGPHFGGGVSYHLVFVSFDHSRCFVLMVLSLEDDCGDREEDKRLVL